MSKKLREKNIRNCEFESRVNILAETYGCTEEEVVKQFQLHLQQIGYVKNYALIVHDKDKDVLTGDIKPKHIHCVIEFNIPIKPTTIANGLGMPTSTIEFIKQKKPSGKRWVVDIGGALSYLTHRNAPDKYQYDDEEVIASPEWNWKEERLRSENIQSKLNLERIIQGIVNGEIKKSNVTEYIDPHIFIENKSRIENAFEYRKSILMKEKNREMECIFISGIRGVGKTTLAKIYCENNDYDYFVTGGTNDPFDGYGGQECIIIDDARGSMFEPEDWLKILDNNTSSLVKARYRNVVLQAKTIIITSTIEIKHFFDCYMYEDAHQLFRRCRIYIKVEEDVIKFYRYRKESGNYEMIKEEENMIRKTYQEEEQQTEDKIESLINKFTIKNGGTL